MYKVFFLFKENRHLFLTAASNLFAVDATYSVITVVSSLLLSFFGFVHEWSRYKLGFCHIDTIGLDRRMAWGNFSKRKFRSIRVVREH